MLHESTCITTLLRPVTCKHMTTKIKGHLVSKLRTPSRVASDLSRPLKQLFDVTFLQIQLTSFFLDVACRLILQKKVHVVNSAFDVFVHFGWQ